MARNKYDVDEDLSEEFNIHSVKRLLKYIAEHKGRVFLTVFLMIVASIASLIPPYLLKFAIDDAIPNKDQVMIVMLAALVLGTQGVNAICLWLRIKIMNRIGQDVIVSLRSDIFRHLQKLGFGYFDSRPHGKILIRVVNYVNSLSDLLSNGIINLITDVFSLVFIIGFMFIIDVRLTLLCLAGLPILAIVILSLRKWQRVSWQAMSRKQSNLNAYLHEALLGVKITQSFGREQVNSNIFKKLNEDWRRAWMRGVAAIFSVWPAIEIISVFGACAVYAVGVAWIDTGITVGTLVAFVGYIWRFWAPINTIGQFYSSLVQSAAYLERIFETIDEKPSIVDAPGATELPAVKGDLRFENVNFSYDAGQRVLTDIDFDVPAGTTVAIVGPTGAGKTTIANLIARFYDPDRGRVLVDGIDVSGVQVKSLRRQVGMMLQDSFLFSGSIRENIRYGRLDATDEEIEAAAKAVCVHDFIMTLEQGYDTPVQERGVRLSGGQRQLISFARALLADPAILILDEATSSVDTETERMIQKALGELLKNRSSFVIAHRLSTIRNADRIMLVEKGRIAESGSHDELMAKGGAYAKLYGSSQASGLFARHD